VPVEEIQRGIRGGVRKVNIDTDIRLAMTGAMRRSMAEHPRRVRPPQGLAGGQERGPGDLQGTLRGVRLRRPGFAHQALPLEAMARRYS